MKKAILLLTGTIIAAIALVIHSQEVGPVINQISQQRISHRNANGELLRTNMIQLDSVTHITTLIIAEKPRLNNFHNTL